MKPKYIICIVMAIAFSVPCQNVYAESIYDGCFRVGPILYRPLSTEEPTVRAESSFSDVEGKLVIPPYVTYEGVEYKVVEIDFCICSPWPNLHSCKWNEVDIPYTVEKLEDGCFSHTQVERVNVDAANPYFTSIGGAVYSKDGTILYSCPRLCRMESLPDNLEVIRRRAFWYCGEVASSLVLPESLKTIGEEAFSDVTCLTEIKFPSGIDCIPRFCFQYTGLVEVVIPGNVKTVENSAFGCCESLQKIVFEDGVETVGDIGSHVNEIHIGSTMKSFDLYCVAKNEDAVVTCTADVPPMVLQAFDEFDIPGTLYVPKESVQAYKSAAGWKKFSSIFPIGYVSVTDPDLGTTERYVHTEASCIHISYPDGVSNAEIYDTSGRLVARTASDRVHGLSGGIYIVKLGSYIAKIVL